MKDKELQRSNIEATIRRDAWNNQEDFPKAHSKYYEIYFEIFAEQRREYEESYSHMKKIEYIQMKGMLDLYQKIVEGKAEAVRAAYYQFLDTRRKKRERKEEKIRMFERIKKEKEEYRSKVMNGTNTPFDDAYAKRIVEGAKDTYRWNCKMMGIDP